MKKIKKYIIGILFFYSYAIGEVFVPRDLEEPSLILTVEVKTFQDEDIKKIISNDDISLTYKKLLKGYLEVVDEFVQNGRSDKFKSYVSKTFIHDKYAPDAWGLIKSKSDRITIRKIYAYANNYFVLIGVNDSSSFVNLIIEGDTVKITNKILRDGSMDALTSYIDISCNLLDKSKDIGALNTLISLWGTDDVFSSLDINTHDIMELVKLRKIPAVGFRSLVFQGDVSLKNYLVSSSTAGDNSEVRQAVEVYVASSRALAKKEYQLYKEYWVTAEQSRISEWLQNENLKWTMELNYGHAEKDFLLAAVYLNKNSLVLYLNNGEKIIYLKKILGVWKISENAHFDHLLREILKDERIIKYFKGYQLIKSL